MLDDRHLEIKHFIISPPRFVQCLTKFCLLTCKTMQGSRSENAT